MKDRIEEIKRDLLELCKKYEIAIYPVDYYGNTRLEIYDLSGYDGNPLNLETLFEVEYLDYTE